MKNLDQTHIIIFHILVLIFFFLLWFGLSLYYNSYDAFTIISYNQNASNSVMPTFYSPLLKGQSIDGEFTAQENHLGIVSVRFYTFHRINKDIVRFSIKEKGDNKWYFQNVYKVNQFQWDKFFTFGFPIIDNSKRKKYIFEITSLYGTKKDAITLSKIQPVLLTKYQFNKSQLLSSPIQLAVFFYKKFLNSISNIDFVISSIVYAVPFFIYSWIAVIWYIYRDHKIFKRLEEIHGTIAIILIVIFLNILIAQQLSSNLAIYIILGVWLFAVFRYKLEGKISYFLALILLLCVPLTLSFRANISAEQSAVWSLYFFLFGLLQQCWELIFNPKNRIPLTKFLKKMNIFNDSLY